MKNVPNLTKLMNHCKRVHLATMTAETAINIAISIHLKAPKEEATEESQIFDNMKADRNHKEQRVKNGRWTMDDGQ